MALSRPGLWVNGMDASMLCVGRSGLPGCVQASWSLHVTLLSSLSGSAAGISYSLGSMKPGREHSGL